MKRLLIDLSSVLWSSIFAGTDKEFGKKVEFNGRMVTVNSAEHAYENAIESILAAARHGGVVPANFILVHESGNTKGYRTRIFEGYKSKGRDKPEEAYEQFNLAKEKVLQSLRDVGACSVTQPHAEADDIIAYLVEKLDGDKVVVSNDGDLAALLRPGVAMWKSGQMVEDNPFGPWDTKYIRLYKALVGDSSDGYPGANGFGDKAFLNLAITFDDAGLDAFCDLLDKEEAYFEANQKVSGKYLATLTEDVSEFKPLQKVIDNADTVVRCWLIAKLHSERIDTMRQPLQWKAGMVKPKHFDERLRPYGQQVRLITAGNYDSAKGFLQSKIRESEFFCIDLETTVPPESDEWLALRNSKGVDVIASTIVGCGLTFGSNQQFGFYLSVDHADTDNLTIDQLRDLLAMLPKDKITVAHNAAGFELPVMYNAFAEAWKDNGWRGFFPNMVDSRIAASYWDENQPTHGLKALSKLLLDYDQETYEEVTGGKKMDELSAEHVLSYGLDDVFCTVGIWNFFRIIMEIEESYEAFLRIEQKPMYLSALSYVQGTPISLQRLRELKDADEAEYARCEEVLNAYLIDKGWEGTSCPEIAELTPAAIKTAVQTILGMELKTQVRTVSKLSKLVELLDHDDAPLLARFIEEADLAQINDWMAKRFDGKPAINVGSNKQLTTLLYETMGLPIRLRNEATDTMRANGVYEGNPKADEDAMEMAIKVGDASDEVKPVLQALTKMKSINTKRGLYWNPYPDMVHWKTKRLHPEVRQCATNTRRHTSGKPNIQQLDSEEGGVRSVILPHHKDAVFVSLDCGSQELRLLADMSRDENMLSAYVGDNLKDLHSFTAAMILGISYDEFRARYKSKDHDVAAEANKARQVGKVVAFSSSYGAMAAKISESLGVSTEVAQGYLDSLSQAFPGLGRWKKETEAFAEVHGWVPVHGGTRRHLSKMLLSDDKWVAQKALRQASNSRIQSAGGSQIRLVMGAVWDSDLLDLYDFRFYWPVHDELCVSVGRGDAKEAIAKVHKMMCAQFLNAVPSTSSIGIGRTFGNLIEIGEVADPELIRATVEGLFEKEEVTA